MWLLAETVVLGVDVGGDPPTMAREARAWGLSGEAWVVTAGVFVGTDQIAQSLVAQFLKRAAQLAEQFLVAPDVAEDGDRLGADVAPDPIGMDVERAAGRWLCGELAEA